MQIVVTFRHMETSEPVRDYAEEKIARVKKYIEEPIDAQVVLSVEKKIRHNAEVTIVAKGITIKGSEETNDMYAAIDAVVDKIERQLKRYKEKSRCTSRPAAGSGGWKKALWRRESIEKAAGADHHPQPTVSR